MTGEPTSPTNSTQIAAELQPLIIGWEEWVALPALGLPAIKAKVDTGARTSALHAFLIEPFGTASSPMVRFAVHPISGRDDIEIYCSAPIADRRDVTSSNGEKESRIFIRSAIEIGGRSWEIEIGLTNRESMSYRMLLGRQAIRDDMMVDPTASFRQPRLSYRLYRHLPRRDPVARALRIAVVSRAPDAAYNQRLADAAQARGHTLECLDLSRLALTFDPLAPGLTLDGGALGHYDAVVPRIVVADKRFGAAVVRQLELMGSFAVNSGDSLDRRANPYGLIQALGKAGVAHAFAAPDATRRAPAAVVERPSRRLRLLVVGGRAIAALQIRNGKQINVGGKRLKRERALAERAAAALGLGLASIEIAGDAKSAHVVGVSARPALGRFEQVTGTDVAAEIMTLIEQRARSWVQKA